MSLKYIYDIISSLPFPVLVTVSGTFVATCAYYTKRLFDARDDLPKLHYLDSKLARLIIENTKILTTPYRFPWWASNGHVQTFMSFIKRQAEFKFGREMLTLADGGSLALDWALTGIEKLHETSPILVVIPGLTGDAQAMAFICRLGVCKGFRPVVFNKRGHGQSQLKTPKLQSFGDPSDLRQAIVHIHERFSNSKIAAFGVSAGSGLMSSYLGEYGEDTYLVGAALESPGYDSEALFAVHLKQPYNFLLLRSLRALVSQHANQLGNAVDFAKVMESSTLHQFEENLYCKLYGFKDMSQYWEKNNPMRDIYNLSIPVLCINSLDDPVCVRENVPYDLFRSHPTTMLISTEHGGHCAFIDYLNLDNWAEKVGIEYLVTVLKLHEQHDDLMVSES